MKKILKFIAIFFALVIIIGVATCSYFSKSIPEGIESTRSDEIVETMWAALNKQAWDTTTYVRWSFRGAHNYIWDKRENLAEVSWDNKRVLLNPDEVTGVVYIDDKKIEDESQKNKVIQKAWSYWCNDMFWLVAPFKVKDPGTTLSIVDEGDGERLKVTYSSGGVTPGDTYVWFFDNKGMPIAYEMYVGILPIKGLYVPWENWTTISTGAKISTSHTIAGAGLELPDVKGGNTLESVGLTKDIWAEIR